MREVREHHIGDADQRRSDRHFPDRRPVMPCLGAPAPARDQKRRQREHEDRVQRLEPRSEEHTSELQSLMRISYAVFCLKKKKKHKPTKHYTSYNIKFTPEIHNIYTQELYTT